MRSGRRAAKLRRGWGSEILVVALGVLVAVLSAWLPSYEGGLVRGVAIVGVAVALALTRRLEGRIGQARPLAPPRSDLDPPPHAFAGAGRLGAVEKATCMVFVGGRQTGTGTLVTGDLVVTAAHVLRRTGPVTVRFRDGSGGAAQRMDAVRSDGDADAFGVAVIRLAPDVAAPEPVELWPARRLPGDVVAFGYPLAARSVSQGVWQSVRVGGVETGGAVRLQADAAGPLAASGSGPVCDGETGLLVGVLVEGS